MKAHVAKTAIGCFAFDDDQKLLSYKLFKPSPADAVSHLSNVSCRDFLGNTVSADSQEDDFARRAARKNVREYAVSLGFVKDARAFNEFMAGLGMELSSRKLSGILTRDIILMHSSNSLESMGKYINILTEHMKEWFWLNYPEFKGTNDEIIKGILECGKRERFPGYSSSYGIAFSEQDMQALAGLARQLDLMIKERERLESYVRWLARETAPNFSFLVDEMLAARMISLAGGLESLAKMPASTLQLLGAEKALFRHLKNRKSRPPKFGVLYDSSHLRNAPAEKKGKVARILSSQLSKAAKIDFYSRRDEKEGLKKEMEKEIENVLKS